MKLELEAHDVPEDRAEPVPPSHSRWEALLRHPRLWYGAALAALVIGVARVGRRAFLDAAYSAKSGKWEEVVAVLLLAATWAGVGLVRQLEVTRPGLLSRLEAWRPAWIRRIDARRPAWLSRLLTRWPGFGDLRWPLLIWALWSLTWILLYHWIDPDWIATGIDWHDSYIGAYAFKYNDPVFYVPWRYPLYPGLAAVLSSLTGLSLPTAIQLLSRLLMTGVALPLCVIGRTLYGRAEGAVGVALLLALTTFFHNSDTVTPYPLVMFVALTALAGLIRMARGGLIAAFVAGASIALVFASDTKGLSLGLALLGAGLGVGVVASGSIGRRLGRVLLLTLPLLGSYQWMHRLPVTPFTLEESSWAVLELHNDQTTTSSRGGKGYVWGKFEDWYTIPRVIQRMRASQTDPTMQDEYARRYMNSINRLKIDYPGVTWRIPLLCLLGVALPIFRRGRSWRDRWVALLQAGCVAAYLYSAWPVFTIEYWERYLLHASVLLPLLAVGAAGELIRQLTGPRPAFVIVRAGVLGLLAGLVLLWHGSALALGHSDGQFDSSLGGRQEQEVLEWARKTMKPGDLLLDASWMMSACLVAGEFPVARPEATYPPQGAPTPSGQWRVTKPWTPATGKRYALVAMLARAPGVKGGNDAAPPPLSSLELKPDNPLAAEIYASSRWKTVFKSADGVMIVLQDSGTTPPDWWSLPPRLRPDTAP